MANQKAIDRMREQQREALRRFDAAQIVKLDRDVAQFKQRRAMTWLASHGIRLASD